MGSPLDTADLESVAKIIVEMRDDIPVPTTCCFAGGYKCEKANAILRSGKIPTYPTPDRAVRALSILRSYTLRLDEAHDPLVLPSVSGRQASRKVIERAISEGRTSLTEYEGKEIFCAYGIPIPGEACVKSANEASKECDRIGYPVVMKIISPDIKHKTDAGGVVIGVNSSKEAQSAYTKIVSSCAK